MEASTCWLGFTFHSVPVTFESLWANRRQCSLSLAIVKRAVLSIILFLSLCPVECGHEGGDTPWRSDRLLTALSPRSQARFHRSPAPVAKIMTPGS